jgi:hypothetical protein
MDGIEEGILGVASRGGQQWKKVFSGHGYGGS